MDITTLFPWLRDHRRHELLATPFPEEWREIVRANVAHYQRLTPDEQAKLETDLRIFHAERLWEGVGGLDLTDEIQVTISALACLLLLGWEEAWHFDNVSSVLVYPTGYVAPGMTLGPDHAVEEGPSARLGEAYGGDSVVIVSWKDARAAGRGEMPGHNVVLHEFAHKLDLRDGTADGVPTLPDAHDYDVWSEVMSSEYQALVADAEHHRHSTLDPYGATNAAEFFAVATEAFFEKSRKVQATHPRLYEVLQNFYHQDPAARIAASDAHEQS